MEDFVVYVAPAIEKSDLHEVLSRKRHSSDEIYLSVCSFLEVPRIACRSRPCNQRPLACSCRLPAAGDVFVFLLNFAQRLFVRTDTYPPDISSCANMSRCTESSDIAPWCEWMMIVCVVYVV